MSLVVELARVGVVVQVSDASATSAVCDSPFFSLSAKEFIVPHC